MEAVAQVRLGHLPTRACRRVGITWSALRKACDSDKQLDAMLLDAMQECRDMLAELLITITDLDEGELGETDVKLAKLKSDNIKWLLEKYWPDKFGQKIKVETGRADEAIIAALNSAINRIPLPAPVMVIEGQIVDPPLVFAPMAPIIDLTVEPDLADLI